MTKIFDGLASADPEIPRDRALHRDQVAVIARTLETAKATIAEKHQERTAALAREKALKKQLHKIENEQRNASQRLDKIRPAAVLEKARESKQVKALSKDLLEATGSQGGDVAQAVATARELRSTWGFLANAAQRLGPVRTSIVVAVTVAFLAAAVFAETMGVPVAGTIAAATGWLGALAAVARKPLGQIRRAASAGDELLTALHAEQRTAVRRREASVQQELSRLAGQRAHIDAELQNAQLDAERATREIDDIQSGRRITQFVQERAASAEYREYLGVIALIRRDFDELSKLLLESTTKNKPPFDRIILYIDDLDRCRAELVVQVLEAVHLLLALKLFVVVVGVDPRWLTESLQHHYIAQLGLPDDEGKDDAESDWSTTPQNYLEKIFQIPFALRPMGSRGYTRMMGQLFEVTTTERSTPQPAPESSERIMPPETER